MRNCGGKEDLAAWIGGNSMPVLQCVLLNAFSDAITGDAVDRQR
jgi:hypothetical protein